MFKNLKFEEGVLESMIEAYMVKPNRLGQIGEPVTPIIELHKCSHKILELTKTSFNYEILNTPQGRILSGIKSDVVFRPLIFGEKDENGVIVSGEIVSINAIIL